MPARKLYIEFDESVAQGAAVAARHSGMSLSEWINAAARHVLEDGYFEFDVDAADGGAVDIDIEEEVVAPVVADNAFLYVDPTTVGAGDTTGSNGELDTIEIESWLDVDADGGGGRPQADDEPEGVDQPTDDQPTDDRPTDDRPTPALDEEQLVWADPDEDASVPGGVGSDVAPTDEVATDVTAGAEAASDKTEDGPAEGDDISQLELLFAGEAESTAGADSPPADDA